MQKTLNHKVVSRLMPCIVAFTVICFSSFGVVAYAAKDGKGAQKPASKVKVTLKSAKKDSEKSAKKNVKAKNVEPKPAKTKALASSKKSLKTQAGAKDKTKTKQKLVAKKSRKSTLTAASKRQKNLLAKKNVPNLRESTDYPSQSGSESNELRFTPVSYAPSPLSSRQSSHTAQGELGLRAASALVMDQDTGEVLLSKNPDSVLPIASITKLMTAMVVREGGQALDEYITLTVEDVISLRGTRSRLRVGDTLSRGDLMHIMLMSSENMAAHALGRSYPGGFDSFVAAMRNKAATLGMENTDYEDASGLSNLNRSSAKDLATLMRFAYVDPVIRLYTTSPEKQVFTGSRLLQYSNTNALVRSGSWEIGLQKTGFISAAGSCLVMQATVGSRKVLMVFLDAPNKYARISNAEKVLEWVQNGMPTEQQTYDTPLAANLDWSGRNN